MPKLAAEKSEFVVFVVAVRSDFVLGKLCFLYFVPKIRSPASPSPGKI